MAQYKSPGVYVEEIPLFPPSVAEVETAVPAFIGYTAKADEFGPGDLRFVPTKVTSLLEYESIFGGAPQVSVQDIALDENNVVGTYDIDSNFYLYDSLRLFFANGGGKCYIISVGSYKDSPSKSHFETGLNALKKKDEPTIILFPDAVRLDTDLYEVQKQALMQCSDLQDRVAVFDLLESRASDAGFDWEKGVEEFRDRIGINSLKYGAAYTPWLRSNLGVAIRYRDLKGKVTRGGSVIGMEALTDSTEVKATVISLNDAVDDVNRIGLDMTSLMSGKDSLKAKFQSLIDTFRTTATDTNFGALVTFIYNTAEKIDKLAAGGGTLKGSRIITDIKGMIGGSLKTSMTTLISYDKGAETAITPGAFDLYKAHAVTATEWGGIFVEATSPAADTSIYTGADNTAKLKAAEKSVTAVFSQVNAVMSQIIRAAGTYESEFENSLYETHPVYKNMINKLSSALTTIPPSGAIAGVYAMVDGSRGVWKAPANVSLNGVAGVTEFIDNSEQDGLNVDVVAGKSINAIRPFTGRGIIVWGARTLAGNDNEWRYVPVRRFFNMVEESVKKSTNWAVFEPNDANTWIKVKSMIENYLIQKWRDGALAGAKPSDAFFVKVGLGITMTAQDILEGRMNVEIGMAAVRPAEFIILKFSHKMQES